MKKKLSILLILLSLPLLLSQCASTTLIDSKPQGAKVLINGEVRGVTPYQYSDTKVIFSTTQIKLQKDGYEDLQVTLQRSEAADVGPIVGGFFLFPFWLWSMKYNDTHYYELVPLQN